jgi:hypothetical protein
VIGPGCGMRRSRPAMFALAFALGACGRSSLEEDLARDLDAAPPAPPPADAPLDVGSACGAGVVCGTSMTCPAGEELCNMSCPERQNFAPPVCMPGPCPANVCLKPSGDGASR